LDISHLLGTRLQNSGFTLEEPDDHLVVLKFKGQEVASWNTHKVLHKTIIEECNKFLYTYEHNLS